jgi:hypothetical protein
MTLVALPEFNLGRKGKAAMSDKTLAMQSRMSVALELLSPGYLPHDGFRYKRNTDVYGEPPEFGGTAPACTCFPPFIAARATASI